MKEAMTPKPQANGLDEIREKIHQGMYDHMSEKGCTQVTNEVMEQIQALIREARIDELETRMRLEHEEIMQLIIKENR